VKHRTGSLFLTKKAWAAIAVVPIAFVTWLALHKSSRSEESIASNERVSQTIANSHSDPGESPNNSQGETEIADIGATTDSREIEVFERPLAFCPPPANADWSEEQLSRLAMLREEFAAAVGGWDQNPNDQGYRERWIQAQPWIDEQFATLFGSEALSEQQLQATRRSR
jgi:hypothetical protein